MINNIKITNHLGESITMELRFPEKSGFLIRSITGLGPSKATINTTETMSLDGAMYNSARVSSRNIVFDVGFVASPTIEDTRQKLYKYFPLKQLITVQIETDRRTCQTLGYVESAEPDIFSKDEGAIVSIICPDPYFYSADGQRTLFSGAEPLLEFPYSNESLEDKVSEFGYLSIKTKNTVLYTGDSPTGIMIYIHAIGPATNLEIFNTRTRQSMHIIDARLLALTGSTIIEGDDIIISTIKGSKYIVLVREGVETNILNCLDKDADWFQILNGDNIFTYTTDTGVTNLQFRVENQIAYEGV